MVQENELHKHIVYMYLTIHYTCIYLHACTCHLLVSMSGESFQVTGIHNCSGGGEVDESWKELPKQKLNPAFSPDIAGTRAEALNPYCSLRLL